jgi:hypothetical protein
VNIAQPKLRSEEFDNNNNNNNNRGSQNKSGFGWSKEFLQRYVNS